MVVRRRIRSPCWVETGWCGQHTVDEIIFVTFDRNQHASFLHLIFSGETEALLCKFADGGNKKRNQNRQQQQQQTLGWGAG